MFMLYELQRVERLPGTGRALASRQPDGGILVRVLVSLPPTEVRRAARLAVRELLLAEGRPVAAFALPALLALRWLVKSNWVMAGGAAASTVGMSTALVLGMHAEPFHQHPAAIPPPSHGHTAVPTPTAQAGPSAPGQRGKSASAPGVDAGIPQARAGHGMSSSAAAAPSTPPAVPPPSHTPEPSPTITVPVPSPSVSVTLPAPAPTPTITVHHHKHKICLHVVLILGVKVCVKL